MLHPSIVSPRYNECCPVNLESILPRFSSMGKTKSSKNKAGVSARASTSKAEQPTATDLIGRPWLWGFRLVALSTSSPVSRLSLTAQAHAYLGQSNFEQAINSLALALDIEPANREAKEILGIAEIEGGDVDKGREVSL
jgi:hypothetical protein